MGGSGLRRVRAGTIGISFVVVSIVVVSIFNVISVGLTIRM
jgi:hypothetical protein